MYINNYGEDVLPFVVLSWWAMARHLMPPGNISMHRSSQCVVFPGNGVLGAQFDVVVHAIDNLLTPLS